MGFLADTKLYMNKKIKKEEEASEVYSDRPASSE
jgi:hypothetical protein